MPFFDLLFDFTCFMGWKWISIITIPLFVYLWQNKQEIKLTFDRTEKGSFFCQFFLCFYIFMPGGRARGNPVQIFFEYYQNFPSIDWKTNSLFDIAIRPPYTWHMNFGPAPLSWDFSILGAQWYKYVRDLTYLGNIHSFNCQKKYVSWMEISNKFYECGFCNLII